METFSPNELRIVGLLAARPAHEDLENPLMSLRRLIDIGVVREREQYRSYWGGRWHDCRELILTEKGRQIASNA